MRQHRDAREAEELMGRHIHRSMENTSPISVLPKIPSNPKYKETLRSPIGKRRVFC